MKRKKTSALLCLMMLAAALWLLPMGAAADISFGNYGYPYGTNMSGSSITLVISIDHNEPEEPTYQWEVADSENGPFTAVNSGTGARAREYTFTAQEKDSGKWYRCTVGGILNSEAVMVVKANATVGAGKDWKWTNMNSNTGVGSPDEHWYISNGKVAYWVNGQDFNVMGLHHNDGSNGKPAGDYMLQTSYRGYWKMYSNFFAEEDNPAGNEEYDGHKLRYLMVSFNTDSPYVVSFEAGLNNSAGSSANAFSISADTQLGDWNLLGTYADKAALLAQLDSNHVLQKTTMIGSASADDKNAPAFVIAPVSQCSRFWLGVWNNRMTYSYNTYDAQDPKYVTTKIGTENVVTRLQDIDSGMTMSWLNRRSGGTVRFQFGVGDVVSIGAVGCRVNYFSENLESLEEKTVYNINAVNSPSVVYEIETDDDGRIPLTGTDRNNRPYSFIGKTIRIAKQNNTDSSKRLDVANRPAVVLPTFDQIYKTETQVSFPKVDGQVYQYSTDDGQTWITLTDDNVNGNGNIEIPNLATNYVVNIRARVSATTRAPKSDWTDPLTVTALPEIKATVADWNGVYDGNLHSITVNVTTPSAGATVTYSEREDGVYDEQPPQYRNAGSYRVYYRIKAADYAAQIGSAEVKIAQAPLDLRVSIANWMVGDAPSEPSVTGNLGGGAVSYAYKPKGAGDSAYSTETPTLAGDYTIRANVAETANYLPGEATADFAIVPKAAVMPETGDDSRLLLWLALCLLTGAGMLGLERRRRNN